MKRFILLLGILLAATAWAGPAQAEAPRLVCLVAALSGQATLSPADGGKKPLEVFTRLREGERIDLARGAEAQLAFLQKGVRETWTGPATVVITAAGGQSADSAAPPAVEKLLGRTQYRQLLEEPGHIQKEAGKPTLVPASDKREAIKPQSAADVFKI